MCLYTHHENVIVVQGEMHSGSKGARGHYKEYEFST